MTRTDSGVEVGRLNDRVDVLELVPTALETDAEGTSFGSAERPSRQPPAAWEWERVRLTWAGAELMTRPNVYSVHGLGAAGVTFTLRRQSLDLDNALRWRGQHCLITAIRPKGRLYLTVEAALVVLSQCRNPRTGETFPAVMTEKYVRYAQLEPMAENEHHRVLVTPKAVSLTPGPLVVVDGVEWPIQIPHELDPHKNEYEIARVVTH